MTLHSLYWPPLTNAITSQIISRLILLQDLFEKDSLSPVSSQASSRLTAQQDPPLSGNGAMGTVCDTYLVHMTSLPTTPTHWLIRDAWCTHLHAGCCVVRGRDVVTLECECGITHCPQFSIASGHWVFAETVIGHSIIIQSGRSL